MIRIHALAIQEIREARAWYGTRNSILATAFEAAIEEAIARIDEGPERWPKGGFGTRHYVLRRFPYLIIYQVAGPDVRIGSVSHAHRRPAHWKARFKDSF